MSDEIARRLLQGAPLHARGPWRATADEVEGDARSVVSAPKPLDRGVADRLALRLEDFARKVPERAKEALAAVVTPIVLKPVRTGETRGYVAEGAEQ